MSDRGDIDKSFERALEALLRGELEAPGSSCPHPGMLSAYFDRKLAETEAAALEFHLATCAGCQRQMATLVRLEPPPAAEPTPVSPSDLPPAEVASEPTSELPSRWRWRWLVAPLALAATAVIAISVTGRFAPPIEEASRRAFDHQTAMLPAPERPASLAKSEASAPPPASASPPALAREILGETAPSRGFASADQEVASRDTPVAAESDARISPPSAPTAAPIAPAPAQSQARQEGWAAMARQAPAAQPLGGQAVPPPATLPAPAKDAAQARAVLVVARSDLEVVWRLTGSSIERSDDGGKTWRAQASRSSTALLSGSAPSPQICWVAGRRGVVLRTLDGERWKRLSAPTSADLTQISAWSSSGATVRTESGERFTTSDGGRTWSKL